MHTLVLLQLIAVMSPAPFAVVDQAPDARDATDAPATDSPDTTVSRAVAGGCGSGSGSNGSDASCRGSTPPIPIPDDSTSCSGDDSSDDDSGCDSGDDDDADSCDSSGGDGDDCSVASHRGAGHHGLATGLVWASLPVPVALLFRRRARQRTTR